MATDGEMVGCLYGEMARTRLLIAAMHVLRARSYVRIDEMPRWETMATSPHAVSASAVQRLRWPVSVMAATTPPTSQIN